MLSVFLSILTLVAGGMALWAFKRLIASRPRNGDRKAEAEKLRLEFVKSVARCDQKIDFAQEKFDAMHDGIQTMSNNIRELKTQVAIMDADCRRAEVNIYELQKKVRGLERQLEAEV